MLVEPVVRVRVRVLVLLLGGRHDEVEEQRLSFVVIAQFSSQKSVSKKWTGSENLFKFDQEASLWESYLFHICKRASFWGKDY